MNVTVEGPGTPAASARGTPGAGRVLLAGLVAGVADALFAMVLQVAYTGELAPVVIFQGIASGLLGPSAFDGGAPTTALGVALHLSFACAWVVAYAVAYRIWPMLRDATAHRPGVVVIALVFGAIVWTVMNYVAKPIGGMSPTPAANLYFVIMTLGHGMVVGLPAVLLVRGAAAHPPRQSM